MKDQLDILKKLGLGKRITPVERVKWTEDDEVEVYHLYCNKDRTKQDIESVAELIGHSVSSVKMKMGNIEAVISGSNKGLKHISKLTVDVVNAKGVL